MPSPAHSDALPAVALCALLMCAHGAPLGAGGPGVQPPGDEGAPDKLLAALNVVFLAIERQQKTIEAEFCKDCLEALVNDTVSSFLAHCAVANFHKEACHHLLLEGLAVYAELLKYVEWERPTTSNGAKEAGLYMRLVIDEFKKKMRYRGPAEALTSTGRRLLRDFDLHKRFHRKVVAHTILSQLHAFLIHCRTVAYNGDSTGGSKASGGRGRRSALTSKKLDKNDSVTVSSRCTTTGIQGQ